MDRRQFIQGATLLALAPEMQKLHVQALPARPVWLDEFESPPDSARPWVYAFWMEGNVTREGISADLLAMKEAGIGGLIFMDGGLGNPPGPHRFMSASWLELFSFLVEEAGRLGIEINLNNAPGWAGSGGPWIKPEQATQTVIVAEMLVEDASQLQGPLTKPAGIRHDFYRDIAVLAFPASSSGTLPSFRIPGIATTKSFAGTGDFFGVVPWPRFIPTDTNWPEAPHDQCIRAASMLDLTSNLDSDGHLKWAPPPGRWIVLRFGHTVANGGTRSAQPEAAGLECDKLSKSAVALQFSSMAGKLSDLAASLAGKALVSTHIDSWEAGSSNWTDGFRGEFRNRRGYDLLPYLPTLNGIVVDTRTISERFLWDYRETVCELTLENYAAHMRELAHEKGMRLSIEAYDGTVDDLRYAGRADEPMSEFWRSCYSGAPLADLNESMCSAAHVYGRNIVGSESFTAMRGDFVDHPATLKPLGDWAFCTGVNRICFSEWVMQPWRRIVPGVSFAFFGTVFHESLTWWDMARPWHQYAARCQHMLRQGSFVADICFVAPEGGPYRFTPPIPANVRGVIPNRPPYNFDGCPAELVFQMKVEEGSIVLASGMRYHLLVLPTYNANGKPVLRLTNTADYAYQALPMPEVKTMTPALLRKVKELVEAGATVLGHRPLQSPSLSSFPACDVELQDLADSLWGKDAGRDGTGERKLGKGRVVWGGTPEEVFAAKGLPPDFSSSLDHKLNYTHRQTQDGMDIYFVVNNEAATVQGDLSFRASGKHPELYWPQTGHSEMVAVFRHDNGVTRLPIALHANESVFVVLHKMTHLVESLIAVSRADQQLWPVAPAQTPETQDAFTLALWITPAQEISLPQEQGSGWSYLNGAVEAPALGFQTFLSPGEGNYGFAAGKNGVVVFQYGESGKVEPILVHATSISGPTLIGVVYENRIPRLYLNGKLARTGPQNPFPPRSSRLWMDHRFSAGELAAQQRLDSILGSAALHTASERLLDIDVARRIVWQSGEYTLRSSTGRVRNLSVNLPQRQKILGPWQVAFDPVWGGPPNSIFPELQDWSQHTDEGIRFYSGVAVYRNTFGFSRPLSANERVYLDLGEVAVIAEVRLNSENLGILWNAPYRVDATEALKQGQNKLEVSVVNVWTNRIIGDQNLPADSEVDASGIIKKWPQWVLEQKKSPTGRFTFTSARQWERDSTLVQSGLLGPVELVSAKKFDLPELTA